MFGAAGNLSPASNEWSGMDGIETTPLPAARSPRVHALRTSEVEALVRLLPVLASSEDAAATTFARLARDPEAESAAQTLAAIAREETRHLRWVECVGASLGAERPFSSRPARRFHLRIGRGGLAARLATVAAIDSAACLIFAALLAPGRPLARSESLARVFARIHRDEARHVRVAHTLAQPLAAPAVLRATAAAARDGLADLLALSGDAFEGLGVDANRLSSTIRRVPPGLFAL